MSGDYFLDFRQNEEGALFLPHHCGVSVNCYESPEVQRAVATSIEESLYALALSGMDLRSLDGITVTLDTRQAACDLQELPEGCIPLEMNDRPETLELARTVAVKSGDDVRFHIVLRSGLGLMTLSSNPEERAGACGCIAHEAAHVEHEGHLYKIFPNHYGRALDCGERSKQTFIKAVDVWSEYAACRSAAMFRPEALEDFDKAFCMAITESRSASQRWIESFRDGGKATDTFREIQQLFGDAFICAGYLLGHLHGLEVHEVREAPVAGLLLSLNPPVGEIIAQLGRELHKLWLSEFAWQSIEVFGPIYDLLCEMMALHGLAFARHDNKWRVIMSDEGEASSALKDFLIAKAKERPH